MSLEPGKEQRHVARLRKCEFGSPFTQIPTNGMDAKIRGLELIMLICSERIPSDLPETLGSYRLKLHISVRYKLAPTRALVVRAGLAVRLETTVPPGLAVRLETTVPPALAVRLETTVPPGLAVRLETTVPPALAVRLETTVPPIQMMVHWLSPVRRWGPTSSNRWRVWLDSLW